MVEMVHVLGPSCISYFCNGLLFLFLNVVHIVHYYLSITKARVIIFPTLLILTAAVVRGGSLNVSRSRQVQRDYQGHGVHIVHLNNSNPIRQL